MKVLQKSRGGISDFLCVRELTSIMLVFLFLITPLAPVFAEADQSSSVSSTDSSAVDVGAESAVEPNVSETAEGQVITDEGKKENEKGAEATDDKIKDEKGDKNGEDAPLDPAAEMASTSEEETTNTVNQSTNKQILPRTDEAMGALVYEYPIVVPPGRNGMQPDLGLSYNSQSSEEGSIFGVGWSINIPYIERINRKGSEKLYTENYFNSSMSGELLLIEGNSWGAKVDTGDFLKYTFSDNSWIATDKVGTKYKFGNASASRQDDPSDSTKVYKWMLEEVRDMNGNYIRYEYFKDGGQIYPSRIIYTGNGTTDGIFEVKFVREARTDITDLSYKTSFLVKTLYRISEIQTWVSGALAKKYTLSYSNIDNGKVSNLNTIIESGKDDSGNTVSLPPTDFNYTDDSNEEGWRNDTSWSYPVMLSAAAWGDINGDGLQDIVYSYKPRDFASVRNTYINKGNGTWVTDPNYQAPVDFFEDALSTNPRDKGARLADVNGDGLVDIVYCNSYARETWLNSGNGWVQSNIWRSPLPFAHGNGGSDLNNSAQLTDVNGDGLIDMVRYDNGEVHLNNGSGWTKNDNWTTPVPLSSGVLMDDINGDSLADLLQSYCNGLGCTPIRTAYINNGSGWTQDSVWAPPADLSTFNTGSGFDSGIRLFDYNGDRYPDLVRSLTGPSSPSPVNYMNTGHGWVLGPIVWNPSVAFGCTNNAMDTSSRIVDIDGDRMPDLIHTFMDSGVIRNDTWINKKVLPDMLNQIIYPKGGNTSITYKPTTFYRDASGNLLNSTLPSVVDVVYAVVSSDGYNEADSRQFKYEGGRYYYAGAYDRKFSGFAKVVSADKVENKTINYYHQGDTTNASQGEYDDHVSKIGKIYRTETTDAAGNIYSKTINKWDRYDLGNGRSFVKQIQQTNSTYDGNATHKDSAELYSYDNATGNLIQKRQVGEVSASDNGTYSDVADYDDLVTNYTYANNAGANILALPSGIIKANAYGEKITEDRYYYDWQSSGEVIKGNETRRESWIGDEDYAGMQKAYDDFGSVVITTDARGSDTFYDYDAFNLYPVLVTNPLGQTTSYTYDYSSGQVKQMTDANGRVFQNVYDGLDRLIAEKQPDLTTPANLVSKSEYVYTDTAGAASVQKKDYLSASAIVNSITYFDGLGRKIQERKQAEGTNYEVKDYAYNNLDLLQKASLLYFSAGSAKTIATATAALYTNYTYDPMYRIVTQVDAAGTISNLYDDRKMTVTDRNGKKKNLYKDVYGRLVRVDEYLAGVAYPTFYEYDGANNLTKITDAAGNVRHFTYNGLGLRWSAEDLHAPDDDTYGVWYFNYDSNGNLTSSTNPNGQTVYREYDELNRILAEDYAGEEGTEVIYEYDSGTNGIGRLRLTIAKDYEQINNYNPLGNIASEIKTIGGEDYTTSYTYDRQGNVLTIINPDNSAIKYTYGTGGLLNTVSRKESSSTSYSSVITNFDYSPTEQLTITSYANGMKTTNVYNAAKLYRLSSKTTTIANAVKGQSIAYTYDNNGNITKLVDSSATDSKKTVVYTYDDLNRLLSATATGVATGQSNYTEQYVYDIIGNIVSKTGQGTYEYNGNQGDSYANPHAVTNIDGMEFTYDKNGNLLTKGSELINTWNYDNRLISDIAGDITNTYTYDSSGQRLTSSDGGATTIYANKYYNTNDGNATKHIFANNLEVAVITGTDSEAIIHYTATDHLTGSSLTTNPSNAKEELLDYLPFGTIRIDQKTGDYTDQRKYAGYEYDNDTGLSYANARYYDGGTGRFISQDPAFLAVGDEEQVKSITQKEFIAYLSDPQGFNSYAYANNNPLKYIDITGESPALLPYLAQVAPVLAASIMAYAPQIMTYGQSYIQALWTPVGQVTMSQAINDVNQGRYDWAAVGLITMGNTSGQAMSSASNKAIVILNGNNKMLSNSGRQFISQTIQNQKLRNIFNSLYKASDTMPGGTAGAITYERLTGKLMSPTGHLYKGQASINGLNKLIQNPNVSNSDKAIAKTLLNQLKNAINGK